MAIKRKSRAEEAELVYNAFSLLTKNGLKLSVAESFTGGMITSSLLAIPGASAFFCEGIVAYSDRAKIDRLFVPVELIAKKTAVSADVCFDMAAGLLHASEADLVIATTGYAGPSAPSESLLGQCFIAVGNREKIHVFKYQFNGSRENIMHLGLQAAFTELINLINNAKVKS